MRSAKKSPFKITKRENCAALSQVQACAMRNDIKAEADNQKLQQDNQNS